MRANSNRCCMREVERLTCQEGSRRRQGWVPGVRDAKRRRQRVAFQGLMPTRWTARDVDTGPELHPLGDTLGWATLLGSGGGGGAAWPRACRHKGKVDALQRLASTP